MYYLQAWFCRETEPRKDLQSHGRNRIISSAMLLIVAPYPHLTLADVGAALACYWDNRDAIDQQMKYPIS